MRTRTPGRPHATQWVVRVGAAAAVAAAGLLTLVAPASPAARPAQVFVTPSTQSPGARVTVTGAGFPSNTNIQASICGNDALDGSADCVQSTSQEVATTKDGKFEVPVVVSIPPKPCPCVVLVLDFSAPATPTVPITIVGAPYATPSVAKLHKLQVLNAYLEGNGPWYSLFGGSPQRTLVLTVRNPNPTAYVQPPLVLTVGQQTNTTTHEATIRNLATIGAYATKIYQVPVTFPAISIGEHQVVGTVGNAGLTNSFIVKTWLFPWGLLIVLLVVLELILLAITRYFRERRRRREEEEARLAADQAGPPTGEVPAVAAVGAVVGAGVGAEAGAGDSPAAAAPAETPPPRPPPPPVL